jgi:phospholipid/cholesterol/gamma-HCH transport system substrate-binding protein
MLTKEKKIGLIIIIVLVILYLGFNYLKGKNIFSRNNIYYVVYENVSGLLESNRVLLKGYVVGEVREIYYDERASGKIIVSLSVRKKVKIPRHTIARIYSADLLGSKAIEFKLSNDSSNYQEGDTIPGEVEIPVTEQIEPIKRQAENILMAIDSLINSFAIIFDKKSISEIKYSIADIRRATSNIAMASGKLDAILGKTESLAEDINHYNDLIKNSLTNFSNFSDSIQASEMKNTLLQINQGAVELNKMIQSVKEGQGTLGKLATNDTLYNNLNSAAKQLDMLLKDIQLHPKNYVRISVFGKK